MLHARTDYQNIQSSETTIAEDEPVFLLRAKDMLAPATLEFWAGKLDEAGGDPETSEHVRQWAALMRTWQEANVSKIPDAPKSVHQVIGDL